MAPTRKAGTGKRGRPKKTVVQSTQTKRDREPQQRVSKAVKGQKGRNRASQAGEEERLPRAAEDVLNRGRKRKKAAVGADEQDEIAVAPTTKAPKYLHLAPKTRRVPQETIEKWPDISAPILEQISSVLKRAKDVIACTRRDPKKQDEAVKALDAIIPQLERHFAATKIPPQAKAVHFDLDHLATLNDRVYGELTTARHRNQLLEEQIERATAKLKEEDRLVERTKENAQQWRKLWKAQEKQQLHPLLQQSEEVTMVDDRPDDIGLKKSAPIDTCMLDAADPELAPLLERLRKSIDAMQGNHVQVDGVDEAVREARVALDDVFFTHASGQQYDAL